VTLGHGSAPVEESKIPLRESGTIPGGDNERVTMAEDVVGVHAAAAIAIGDGITLKQDAYSLVERRNGRNGGDWWRLRGRQV
jgi:hypothetical protein